MEHTSCASLSDQVNIVENSTVSKTVHQSDRVKAVLFGFAAGQELSEHTARVPAIMHILEGQAHVTLGEDSVEASAGFWVHMDAHLPHSISARTDTKMLLTMLRTKDK